MEAVTSQSHIISLNKDVFSSGQVGSKLWLCRQIETLLKGQKPQTVWILGGWAGLLSFLLLSREQLNIEAVRSFDLDSASSQKADLINENWVWRKHKFKAKIADCNLLDYTDGSFAGSKEPDLIINSSVEHFHSKKWYDNIPSGKTVALQSCDLKHPSHIACAHSEEELKKQFPLSKLLYSGSLRFDYKTHSFSRYMLIGEK